MGISKHSSSRIVKLSRIFINERWNDLTYIYEGLGSD